MSLMALDKNNEQEKLTNLKVPIHGLWATYMFKQFLIIVIGVFVVAIEFDLIYFASDPFHAFLHAVNALHHAFLHAFNAFHHALHALCSTQNAS